MQLNPFHRVPVLEDGDFVLVCPVPGSNFIEISCIPGTQPFPRLHSTKVGLFCFIFRYDPFVDTYNSSTTLRKVGGMPHSTNL